MCGFLFEESKTRAFCFAVLLLSRGAFAFGESIRILCSGRSSRCSPLLEQQLLICCFYRSQTFDASAVSSDGVGLRGLDSFL
jgi:hypothetical protein